MTDAAEEATEQPREVFFSAAIAGSLNLTTAGRARAQRIAEAMNQAVRDCLEEGISDPDVHLERKLAARERERALIAQDDQSAAAAAAAAGDE
jgi:hypothetical protein